MNKNTSNIEIPFPLKTYARYLKAVNAKAKDKLSLEQVDILFRSMIIDFRNGNLNADDLSAMASHFWFTYFAHPTDEAWKADEYAGLKETLYTASELAYYTRFPSSTLIEYFTSVLQYPDIIKIK